MTPSPRRRPSPPPHGMSITEALVEERVGLTAHHLPREERARRVRAAMRHAGFADDAAFASFLLVSQSSLLDVASTLSVGETYFFRDPAQLRLFTDEVLPRLLFKRPLDHVLQIWSAGCASGEEPYTIAMLLDERGLLQRARIVATDISRAALEQARAGLYGSWALRAIPPLSLRRYLQPCGRNYQLSPALKAHVRFERRSLTDGNAPQSDALGSGFDLIFCKNVLIYLTPEKCAQVSRHLAFQLAQGGTLMTGASDPFLDLPGLWQRTTSEAGVMYTRLGVAGAAPEQPRAASRSDPESTPWTEAHAAQRQPLPAPARDAPALAADTASGAPLRSSLEALKQYAKREGTARAVDACVEALTAEPLALELHLLHVSLLIELGRDAEAALALRSLLYLEPRLALGHFLSAVVFGRQGERRKAARAYRRVVALCEDQPQDEPLPWGEGVSHGALMDAAAREAAALEHVAAP